MPDLRLKIPPPILFAITVIFMAVLARLTPSLRSPLPASRIIAMIFGGLALIIVALAATKFLRARTTIKPEHPERTSALVTTGIFAVTRNPMYVALVMLLISWSVWLEHPLALLLTPMFVAYLNHFQIAPEEKALLRRFGDDYDAYRRRVRRWL